MKHRVTAARSASFAAILALLAATGPAAAEGAPQPVLKGSYGFTVTGAALVQPTGSTTPTLVPVAILGGLAFQPNGTFLGTALVNVGDFSCIASGSGFGTVLSGNYKVLATGPTGAYAVADFSIITHVAASVPPCVLLNFTGPSGGAPAGLVISADPKGRALDLTLLNGSGTMQPWNTPGGQPEIILSLTASGRALLWENAPVGTGPP